MENKMKIEIIEENIRDIGDEVANLGLQLLRQREQTAELIIYLKEISESLSKIEQKIPKLN